MTGQQNRNRACTAGSSTGTVPSAMTWTAADQGDMAQERDKLRTLHTLLSNTRQPSWQSCATECTTALRHAGRHDKLWGAHALLSNTLQPSWQPGASSIAERTTTLGHAGRHLINFHRGRKLPYPPEEPQEGPWIYDERPIYGPVYQEATPGGGIIQYEPLAFPRVRPYKGRQECKNCHDQGEGHTLLCTDDSRIKDNAEDEENFRKLSPLQDNAPHADLHWDIVLEDIGPGLVFKTQNQNQQTVSIV